MIKKIFVILLMLFIFISAVLINLFFLNSKQKIEDPLILQIKSDVILPFCQTGGEFARSELSQYFTEDYLESFDSGKKFDMTTNSPHTAISGLQEKYRFMFTEYMNFKNCESYVTKMNIVSLDSFSPEFEEDIGYADYVFVYKPSKNVTISLYLKDIDNTLKIKSVGRSANVKVGL